MSQSSDDILRDYLRYNYHPGKMKLEVIRPWGFGYTTFEEADDFMAGRLSSKDIAELVDSRSPNQGPTVRRVKL